MVYETFLETLKQDLTRLLGDDYLITVQKIPKNNGIELDSLCITNTEHLIAPTVYLGPYYEQYQQGVSMETIEQDILHFFQTPIPTPCITAEQFIDPNQVRKKIVYKLIHAKSNELLLQQIPHKRFLDLAIVFYLYLDETEYGQLTSLIHHSHQQIWNLSTEQLFHIASVNTPILFPAKITTMNEIMQEIIETSFQEAEQNEIITALLKEEEPLSPLYVLTNQQGFCGSCCILYPDILKDFSTSLGFDLVILPSSIHEVLLIPYEKTMDFGELIQMVTEINHSEVAIEDQLSNQVYRYSLEKDTVEIADSAFPNQNIILPN